MPTDHLMRCSRHEYALWGMLCRQLVLRRVVTNGDLVATVGADHTPGQRLLNLIREWGDARATLALAAAAQKGPSDEQPRPR